ncbi:CDP-alcohol phosphatidyltransferase family protein [Nocardiopsis sp. FIRDI 009]|uniref:CDP-alcohol phosphatidyltransferase family protein n=1 Tax=Nocardiopsis sp. FIRDI 009 TaxID=714197 RepID=UPI000E26A02C|nr:CDP-alcohol phosphatidyltransferase family protein [Nocardiopsis sp. FIRDI 009]
MREPLRHQVAAAVLAQAALLGGLAVTVGLAPRGWYAGGAYAAAGAVALLWAARRSGRRSLGAADRITVVRALLTGGVLALAVGGGPVWPLVGLASLALVLDLVDGAVARSGGTESGFGAAFDMETDALLIMVLSAFVSLSLGVWVLAIGLMRYVFGAAALVAPWLRAPLPPSRARKAVAALQGVTLVVAASGVLPPTVSTVVVAVALAALVWSFGRDVLGLWGARRRRVRASVTQRT